MLTWSLRAVLAIAVVAFIVLKVDVDAVAGWLTSRLIVGLLASQPFLIGCYLAFALRLRILLPSKPDFRIAYNASVLPIGLNAFLPARLSELVKPFYLHRAAGVPPVEAVTALVLERVLDVVVLGVIALALLPSTYLPRGKLGVIAIAIAIAAILPWVVNRVRARFPDRPQRIWQLLRSSGDAIARVSDAKRYAALLTLTGAGWGAGLLSVYVCLRLASDQPISVGQAGIVYLLTLIGGLLAILPAGVGTFQAAAMIGLLRFGYSAESGAVMAILLQISALAYAAAHSLLLIATNEFSVAGFKATARR